KRGQEHKLSHFCFSPQILPDDQRFIVRGPIWLRLFTGASDQALNDRSVDIKSQFYVITRIPCPNKRGLLMSSYPVRQAVHQALRRSGCRRTRSARRLTGEPKDRAALL